MTLPTLPVTVSLHTIPLDPGPDPDPGLLFAYPALAMVSKGGRGAGEAPA